MVNAAVMGAAIPVMHYTGMAASTFARGDGGPRPVARRQRRSCWESQASRSVTLHGTGTDRADGPCTTASIRPARSELETAEKRYRLLFERSLAGVLRTTLDGRILDCNEACARMFGFASREEMIGTFDEGAVRESGGTQRVSWRNWKRPMAWSTTNAAGAGRTAARSGCWSPPLWWRKGTELLQRC